jgi:hypothetical protein
MTVLLTAAVVLAHAGHWAASILYLMPVFILGGGILWQRRRDRQLEKNGGQVRDEDVPFSDE